MAKRQLPKRLFKQEHVSSYKADRSPTARMKQMSRDHLDVLQNVEFALVTGRKYDPRVDDRAADEALGVALGDEPSEDPRVADLVDGLAAIRRTREDIDDVLWREALRVIRDSVRRHSDLKGGETSYLDFVAEYVR